MDPIGALGRAAVDTSFQRVVRPRIHVWVLRSTRAESFPSRAAIITEGDKGGDFFLITDGDVKVSVDRVQVATLGAGSYFGEMALIDGGAPTATIVAEGAVSTLALSQAAFLRTLEREPMLAQGIYAALCTRLNAAGDQIDCDEATVDRAKFVDVCQRLRAHTNHPEWAPARRQRSTGSSSAACSRADLADGAQRASAALTSPIARSGRSRFRQVQQLARGLRGSFGDRRPHRPFGTPGVVHASRRGSHAVTPTCR
jgi:CRP/FNR family cyclic AMP-dependent transcriptional regulator